MIGTIYQSPNEPTYMLVKCSYVTNLNNNFPIKNHDSSEVVEGISCFTYIDAGWWYPYPSERYSSVGIILNLWKKQNHQPEWELMGILPTTFCDITWND